MKLFYFFSILLLFSCASQQKVLKAPRDRQALFPSGTYYHRVTIEQRDMGQKSFSGVVTLSQNEVNVVGLSDFSTTVFNLHEDRKTQVVSCDIFIDAMKKHRDRLIEFYKVLRGFLLFERKKGESFPGRLILQIEKESIEILFSQYDLNDIPKRVEINHPRFKVHVEVTDYDA